MCASQPLAFDFELDAHTKAEVPLLRGLKSLSRERWLARRRPQALSKAEDLKLEGQLKHDHEV